MSDLLRIDYINSLPQPFMVEFMGNEESYLWDLYDIEVGTGLLRIDVMGKLVIKHISDVSRFIDINGDSHDPETFYSDYEDEQTRGE